MSQPIIQELSRLLHNEQIEHDNRVHIERYKAFAEGIEAAARMVETWPHNVYVGSSGDLAAAIRALAAAV